MNAEINAEDTPANGKEFLVYDWSKYEHLDSFNRRISDNDAMPVGKVTLDIICETAFGYRTDSLHNPQNELAEAYENLLNLQSGTRNFSLDASNCAG